MKMFISGFIFGSVIALALAGEKECVNIENYLNNKYQYKVDTVWVGNHWSKLKVERR